MLRIGVLVDSYILKKWQYEIISYIHGHPQLSLEVVIKNEDEDSSTTRTNSKIAYRAFQALDRIIFKVEHDAFDTVDKTEFLNQQKLISIRPIKKKISNFFSDKDITRVKELNLDVLIRFGFGILKGKILSTPTFGVWSLHHGDNKVNRGGPPGFWEVVNMEKVTGVTLQRLTTDLDGGRVIDKSFVKTDITSFSRNKNQIFWAGVELFNSALDKLALSGEMCCYNEEIGINFYSHPLYRDPSNFSALKIHIEFWKRRLDEFFKGIMRSPQWFILYKFRKNNKIETSIFRYKKLLPPSNHDWADPFVIEKDNEFILFFEELNHAMKKGHISCLIFSDEGELLDAEPKIVLEENYHLSYPFVFNENDKYYLIPESSQAKELWLYESTDFPLVWNKKHQIFSNKEFFDPTLLNYKGLYYLFGTERPYKANSSDQYLSIYFTENLLKGEWHPHPNNPIYRDVRDARPAGRIFFNEGKLIRPLQIGTPKYGYGIQFNYIEKLSPEEFKETKISQISPKWEKDLLATHTFNSISGFSVIDAQGKIKR